MAAIEDDVERHPPPGAPNPHVPVDLFAGGGEMAALMRAFDWSASPLGPAASWPVSLRTMTRLLLNSGAQLCLLWGPELVQLYNDAFRPILGARKHPAALGQRARDCWPEIWDVISPMYAAVLAGGATAIRDGLLVLDRHGYPEECYFDYTYSPLHDDAAQIAGILAICQEVTDRVLSARRLSTLRRLAEVATAVARTPDEACAAAAAALGENLADLPFALIYLLDENGTTARLVATSNIEPNGPASPSRIALGANQRDSAMWPLASVIESGQSAVVTNLGAGIGALAGAHDVGNRAAGDPCRAGATRRRLHRRHQPAACPR